MRRGVTPHWRRRRHGGAHFIFRAGLLFAPLAILIVVGAVRLIGWLLEQAGVAGVPADQPVWPLWVEARVALVALVFWSVMRRVGRPLGGLVGAADRVAEGDFSARVNEYGPPWIKTMARAFNSMTARLEVQHRQRREMMADIAHELRTPLAVMQGRLEGMLDGVYQRDERQVAQVLEDTRLLARLVEDLRTLAHTESGTLTLEKEPTDIAMLVDDAAASLRPEADARRVTLDVRAARDLPLVEIDPVRIREVVTNLLSNAVRYSPPREVVVVDVQAAPAEITICVRDRGAGIPAGDLPRIFDRFHKGSTSTGSGLGLTIAHNLVTAHGGTLRADSRVGAGTTMTVTLRI